MRMLFKIVLRSAQHSSTELLLAGQEEHVSGDGVRPSASANCQSEKAKQKSFEQHTGRVALYNDLVRITFQRGLDCAFLLAGHACPERQLCGVSVLLLFPEITAGPRALGLLLFHVHNLDAAAFSLAALTRCVLQRISGQQTRAPLAFRSLSLTQLSNV